MVFQHDPLWNRLAGPISSIMTRTMKSMVNPHLADSSRSRFVGLNFRHLVTPP